MRNRRIITGAFAAVALAVAGLGTTQAGAASAAPVAASAPAAVHVQKQQKPMDGPPGTVWTGKKFWTLSGCQAAGTDLVSSGKWADPFCDGGGLQYDLWARPL
ncbi:hypothetical protein [Streptomyces pinistramenti]|uniref:hypothetical protein n=1 Tax=Streptomyces pinistramenti TaxID=2884812 RepID=UPI001D06BD51|nr:hypothetical protein [Streptomyces pinistramenti]MCB5907146.1 hypothetical protein [Streptomyces pinistramenti]